MVLPALTRKPALRNSSLLVGLWTPNQPLPRGTLPFHHPTPAQLLRRLPSQVGLYSEFSSISRAESLGGFSAGARGRLPFWDKENESIEDPIIPSTRSPGPEPAQFLCLCNYPHPASPLGPSAALPSPSGAAPAPSPERRLGTAFAPRRRWTARPPPAGGSAVQCPGGRRWRQAQGDSPRPRAPRSHTRPNGSPCSPGGASPLGPLQSSTLCGQRTRGALRRGGWPGRARPRSSSTSEEREQEALGEKRARAGRRAPTGKEGPAQAAFGSEAS